MKGDVTVCGKKKKGYTSMLKYTPREWEIILMRVVLEFFRQKRERFIFKKLAHMTVGSGKSKPGRVGW